MEFDTYQTLADMTAEYPGKGEIAGLVYAILGLSGESGELAGKMKKVLRGDKALDVQAMSAELGDVLWYCAAVAQNLGISLEDVASDNIRKLQSRKERGVIKGEGDNR